MKAFSTDELHTGGGPRQVVSGRSSTSLSLIRTTTPAVSAGETEIDCARSITQPVLGPSSQAHTDQVVCHHQRRPARARVCRSLWPGTTTSVLLALVLCGCPTDSVSARNDIPLPPWVRNQERTELPDGRIQMTFASNDAYPSTRVLDFYSDWARDGEWERGHDGCLNPCSLSRCKRMGLSSHQP